MGQTMENRDMQLKLIAAFLSQYLEANNGMLIPPDEAYIRDGIAVLLEENIMTLDELRMEALRDFNVIVPWNLCPKEKDNGKK